MDKNLAKQLMKKSVDEEEIYMYLGENGVSYRGDFVKLATLITEFLIKHEMIRILVIEGVKDFEEGTLKFKSPRILGNNLKNFKG